MQCFRLFNGLAAEDVMVFLLNPSMRWMLWRIHCQIIRFFVELSVLEAMVVVSNQGAVHYLRREEKYVLNDVEYDFKPLEIYISELNYRVDEKELEK